MAPRRRASWKFIAIALRRITSPNTVAFALVVRHPAWGTHAWFLKPSMPCVVARCASWLATLHCPPPLLGVGVLLIRYQVGAPTCTRVQETQSSYPSSPLLRWKEHLLWQTFHHYQWPTGAGWHGLRCNVARAKAATAPARPGGAGPVPGHRLGLGPATLYRSRRYTTMRIGTVDTIDNTTDA